ncbi:MAG: hypothetical protein PHI24_09160 [Desulfitobacteriaceae bacterium]|nr:hypothetical protein [Desulfitobacteriaceae bacterium]
MSEAVRCTIDIEKIITQQIAAEIIEKIPLEEKEALLLNAIKARLNDKFSMYEVRRAVEAEGLAIAGEYIKTPEVQELIRKKAIEVVNIYVDGLINLLGKDLESYAKNNWRKMFPDTD